MNIDTHPFVFSVETPRALVVHHVPFNITRDYILDIIYKMIDDGDFGTDKTLAGLASVVAERGRNDPNRYSDDRGNYEITLTDLAAYGIKIKEGFEQPPLPWPPELLHFLSHGERIVPRPNINWPT